MAWNLPRIFGQKKKVDITKGSERYREEAKKGQKYNDLVVDITKESEGYREEAKKGQKYNNSVADILAGNRSSKHTPGTSQQTEIKNFTKKSKDLLALAEITEIEDKYSKKSIDALKEQVDKVKAAREELNSSLKALTDLPSNMVNVPQEQATLRAEVNALKRENGKLFFKFSQGKISHEEMENSRKDNNEKITTKENQINHEEMENSRKDNNEKITTKENQINNNDIEIFNFSTGEKVQELSENIKNNLIEFKREVSKLETMVKSIEKGQAPKPPKSIVSKPVVELQPVRVALPPPGTIADKLGKALKEFEAQKNLRTLVKYIESDGVYEGSKEYLLKELDFLKKDLGVISDKELKKIQETLTNPNLTEEKFLQITNSLIETIDRNLESKNDKRRQNFVEKEEERKENREEQFTTRL